MPAEPSVARQGNVDVISSAQRGQSLTTLAINNVAAVNQ